MKFAPESGAGSLARTGLSARGHERLAWARPLGRGRFAFARALVVYTLVVLPLARREIARWRRRAQATSDRGLRELAVAKLRDEHLNAEGAAMFALLRPTAARRLIRLLVAYQLLWDLVDGLLERPPPGLTDREAVRRTLERALTAEAVCSPPPLARRGGENSLLDELVAACRSGCAALPRYREVQPALLRIAGRTDVQVIVNSGPKGRTPALRSWADRHLAEGPELEWAELCAAASSSLAVHALLATAAQPHGHPYELEAVEAAYFPWLCALNTLLDSFVDQDHDARSGDFSFVAQYPSPGHAGERLRAIAERGLEAVRALPHAHRHSVLVCALIAMYLSNPSAQTPQARPVTERLLAATAPLSRWALAVLRWRRALSRSS